MNRQWILKRRPVGQLRDDDFEFREVPEPSAADLSPGGLLIRNRMFLCAPTMRNWMEAPGNALYPCIPLDTPILATAGGEVIASSREGVSPGDLVTYLGHWQDVEMIGANAPVAVVPKGFDLLQAMGPYGLNARTAYFGLLRVGQPKAGETLVVSGAAGSTGGTALQIGKIMGCRVIGIAGGPEKCRWLIDECGADAAIDYRLGDVDGQLRRLCPDGIDLFYDNVGGEMLTAAVENIAKHGRIVLCGQIASYDGNVSSTPDLNMMRLIYGSVRMQGFLHSDYAGQEPEAIAQLHAWVQQGLLTHREDVRRDFMKLPEIFAMLFSGQNSGTLLVEVD